MDEQGIYCPGCRAYVHFWSLSEGGRPPTGQGIGGAAPGTPIEMPQSCKQCGYRSTYHTTDLRTGRVPTEPVRAAMLGGSEARRASTIEVQREPASKKI